MILSLYHQSMKDKYLKTIERLNSDVLRNLSTLKYLTIYRNYADIELIDDSGDWAVMAAFPTRILSYDTATYPKARKAVFLNGTSDKLKYDLLDMLKPDSYILRLNEDLDLSGCRDRFTVSPGHAYISFTCTTPEILPDVTRILSNGRVTQDGIDMFGRNGYTGDDISGYFANGARWFGLTINGRLTSTCFVFQNYGNIWEIAGVHTLEKERRHGYARTVVFSALKYLLDRGLTPRYEAERDNQGSIRLAMHLGMKEFLTIKHYLLEAR